MPEKIFFLFSFFLWYEKTHAFWKQKSKETMRKQTLLFHTLQLTGWVGVCYVKESLLNCCCGFLFLFFFFLLILFQQIIPEVFFLVNMETRKEKKNPETHSNKNFVFENVFFFFLCSSLFFPVLCGILCK